MSGTRYSTDISKAFEDCCNAEGMERGSYAVQGAVRALHRWLKQSGGVAQASSEHRCVPGREDALLTAHEIREAKNAYLDGMGQQGNAERKEKLSQVLHDNATDIANVLEAFALAYALPLPEVQFLLDRLEEYDPGDEGAENDFHGHVAPAIARLRSALSSTQREAGK